MILAGTELARRLEGAEAANARGCAGREGSALLEVAGGVAIFVGAESPLTQAVGIGLNGRVTEAELARLEEFFRCRDARVSIDFCPLAQPDLLAALGERGYRVTEFNNVLVRPLAGAEVAPPPRTRRSGAGEMDLWSRTVGCGFFEEGELTAAEMEVGRAIYAMPEAMCYLAFSESGEPAGGAAAAIRGGLCTLFADSVIPAHRRKNLHRDLISARLHDAVAHGCDLATASTIPGSGSQRNYERLGFQVAYTKITLLG